VAIECEICGSTRGLDRHHVLHKKMGGSREPAVHDHANLISICRRCHTNLHEGGWRLERLPEGIRVVDRRGGAEVMRRLRRPEGRPTALFRGLALIESSFAQVVGVVPYLTDDELVEAFASARSLRKRAWLVQSAILHEAQRRGVYGDRNLEAIARRFEISLRQAQKYALAWENFFARDGADADPAGALKSVNVDAFVLDEPSWYVVAASESPEPVRWLACAQDRKLEDPRYGVAAFRRDIRAARLPEGAVAASRADAFDRGTSARWACPWVRAYCTRSGQAVPVAACGACDADCETDNCETNSREAPP